MDPPLHIGFIERWLPRPAEAGECPEGVQRIRRLGVSMGENAPSGREKLGEQHEKLVFEFSGHNFLGGSAFGVSVFEVGSFLFFSFLGLHILNFGFLCLEFLSSERIEIPIRSPGVRGLR